MSRRLDDLSPAMRQKAFELLARLIEARIPVLIVDTLRTPEEHEANLRKGVSWTKHSRHLDGDAIDICPYEEYALNGRNKAAWNADAKVWQRIGEIGEACGLVWGGRWTVKDLGHFELPRVPEVTA